MKKIISTIFVMSISHNAFANNINQDFYSIKFEKNLSYTCIYEYYEEVYLASGDVSYIYISSEIVECEEVDAGKVFEFIIEQNGASKKPKPKSGPGGRQGGHMTL
ncbi:hypothetical protein [Epilithonimonas arachidiradicis]|nr:hypothetical protein [Epilithonimonas arachidiradicis]RKE87592.1 hypothetical protein BXY58_1710 [Epilithonimonas arachidiradicis]